MNYADIKADDPGGTVDSAFAALSTLTIDVSKSEFHVSNRTLMSVLLDNSGLEYIDFMTALDTAASVNRLIADARDEMKPGADRGIDIVNPATQALLSTIGAAPATVAKIIALAKETVLKYPGITAGDIEYARSI